MIEVKGAWSNLEEGYAKVLARLTLLGTDHLDPAGYRRLMRFLRSSQPDLVLVEMSPYALAFRRRHLPSMRKALRCNLELAARRERQDLSVARRHPEIVAVRRQLGIPFEYRAASAFAERSHARVFLVDKSSFSWRLTQSWRELVSVENLSVLLTSPAPSRSIHHVYRRAYRLIHDPTGGEPLAAMDELDEIETHWARREHFMARQVERILKFFRPERPLYIGGWWHLTQAGRLPTIRSLLEINASQCRLLDDAAA